MTLSATESPPDDWKGWQALMVLCLGVLMIALDTTIVNVALPSIRQDLGFSETALVWVVNAYMPTFGGFLLLGGRLGMAGHKLDVLGAITVTLSLMLAVYGVVGGNESGWTSGRTLSLLGVAALLMGVFIVIEARSPAPLMPLRCSDCAITADVMGVLWAAAMFRLVLHRGIGLLYAQVASDAGSTGS